MKALSIRQPWAWAILHAGKDVENRDWKPWNPGLKYRGPFLIHASQGMTKQEYEDFLDTAHYISGSCPFVAGLNLPAFDELPRGGIVGMATIHGVVSKSPSPWFCGPLALLIGDPKPLPFQPLKGMLGFFEVPESIRETAQSERPGSEPS
jgi:hypothetical protein